MPVNFLVGKYALIHPARCLIVEQVYGPWRCEYRQRNGGLRDQASGFEYESLGVTGRRGRYRDETADDRRATEGDRVDLSIGQRVFHQKFGYGLIVAVDGNKLDIEFEKAGSKKVLDSFIEAA